MLSAAQIAKAVSDLQMHSARKRVFRAEADGKCIVVYGSATCGKERVARENVTVLNAYEKRSYNFDDARDIKRFINQASVSLLYAEAHYSGSRRINFPLKNVMEIFMQ